jgi:hypothetical protein
VRAAIGKVFNIVSFGQIKAVNKYAEETGGEVMGADKKEVDDKLGEMIDRLRSRYAIGFRPADLNDTGKFRPVKITISTSKKRKEKPIVLTRRGYYLRRRTRRLYLKTNAETSSWSSNSRIRNSGSGCLSIVRRRCLGDGKQRP